MAHENLLLMLYRRISWLCTTNLRHKGATQVRAIELRIQLAPLFTSAAQTDLANQTRKGKRVQRMLCIFFSVHKQVFKGAR